MTRRLPGLSAASDPLADNLPDGMFLVRVEKARYHWHRNKPYYLLEFSVLEPRQFSSRKLAGRLECHAKALWKFGWFLRDFAYDPELLACDEIDDKRMLGLRGIVKISHSVRNGSSLLNFEGFGPACQWEQLSFSDLPESDWEVA